MNHAKSQAIAEGNAMMALALSLPMEKMDCQASIVERDGVARNALFINSAKDYVCVMYNSTDEVYEFSRAGSVFMLCLAETVKDYIITCDAAGVFS